MNDSVSTGEISLLFETLSVARNGEVLGKWQVDEVRVLLHQGELRPTDSAWSPELEDWTHLGTLFPQRVVEITPPVRTPFTVRANRNRLFGYLVAICIALILVSCFYFVGNRIVGIDPESSSRDIDRPENSVWDGSVFQVEQYLKRTLRDPESYRSVDWGKVERSGTGYYVWHQYRARNGFGGYEVKEGKFSMDSDGNVTSVSSF